MRQIFFDTETTGLNPRDGHRIAEFAGIEAIDGVPTGRELHLFFNPDREIDEAASKVNGLTWDKLRDKPRFRECADQVISFIQDAEIIAHNAPFDAQFLQAELERIGYPRTVWELTHKVTDTLGLARQVLHSKGVRRFDMDRLLDHFEIDRSMRTTHTAILDSRLLIQVYHRLIEGIDFSRPGLDEDVPRPPIQFLDRRRIPALVALAVSPPDAQAHRAYLQAVATKEKVRPLGLEEELPPPAASSDLTTVPAPVSPAIASRPAPDLPAVPTPVPVASRPALGRPTLGTRPSGPRPI